MKESFKRDEEEAFKEEEEIVENLQRLEKYLAMLYAAPGNPFLDKEQEKDQMYIKAWEEMGKDLYKQEESIRVEPIKIEPPKPIVETKGGEEGFKASPVLTSSKELKEKYNIVYINPELGKPEIIKTTNYISYQTLEQKIVEESLAERNPEKVMRYALERVIKEAQKPKVEVNTLALSSMLRNRDKLIVEIEKERKQIKAVIKELDKTKEKRYEKLVLKLSKLPPLTRKRIEALLKKTKEKEIILKMLLAEDFFLGKLKALLTSLTVDKIKGLVEAIRRVLRK